MHRQCHHLIHYDLPWSLIRIEQRNGRIDRYGQEHQPEFAALILTSQTDGAKDDTTVAEKLLHREEQAHHSLGTAEGITREFTARKEEDRLVKDLLAGKTVDESIEAANAVDDFLADLLAGVGDQPDAAGTAARRRAGSCSPRPRRSPARRWASPAPTLHVDDDGEMLAFAPPDDLVQRLAVLPPNYLKKHNVAERMKVTFDRKLAQRKLDEARKTKTLWPDIAYLSDLHPMIEWLTDKVLLRIARQQAPVLIADVEEPVFLIQGVYSNALGPAHRRGVDGGHRAAGRAAGGRPHRHAQAGGRRARTWSTRSSSATSRGSRSWCPPRCGRPGPTWRSAARTTTAQVDEPLNEYRERVAAWQQDSLLDVPAPVPHPPRAAGPRRPPSELNDMITKLHTAGEPLLRILAVLDGGR